MMTNLLTILTTGLVGISDTNLLDFDLLIFRIVPELPWVYTELQSHQIQGSTRVIR